MRPERELRNRVAIAVTLSYSQPGYRALRPHTWSELQSKSKSIKYKMLLNVKDTPCFDWSSTMDAAKYIWL